MLVVGPSDASKMSWLRVGFYWLDSIERFSQGNGDNYACLADLNINSFILTLPAYRDISAERINPQDVNNY